MSKTFIASILIISVVQKCLGGGTGEPGLWELDKEVVYVGGCVAVTIHIDSREAYPVMIRIDGGEPIRLVDSAGPTVRIPEKTIVLLSHDFRHPETIKVRDGAAPSVRIPPIFEEPGMVRISLESDGVSWGEKHIEVLPVPAGAGRAIDILYPTIQRGDESSRNAGQLMHLLMDPSFGVGSQDDKVQEAKKALELLGDLRKHPDWTEIFEMSIARLEIRRLIRSGSGRSEAGATKTKDNDDEFETSLTKAARCLMKTAKSPFAEAIQGEVRSLVGELRRRDGDESAPTHR